MNKRKFLKTFTIGAAVAVATPAILVPKPRFEFVKEFKRAYRISRASRVSKSILTKKYHELQQLVQKDIFAFCKANDIVTIAIRWRRSKEFLDFANYLGIQVTAKLSAIDPPKNLIKPKHASRSEVRKMFKEAKPMLEEWLKMERNEHKNNHI